MKSTGNKKSNLTIGFIADRLDDPYQARIWPGIVDFTNENNINLIIHLLETEVFNDKNCLEKDLINDEIIKNNIVILNLSFFIF